MKTNTEGLVLTSQDVGDRDTTITILTRDRGIVRCFVRGGQSTKSSVFAAVQPLSYSYLTIFHGKSADVIDEAVIRRSFFDMQSELERLTLEQYFCELLTLTVPENVDSSAILDLALNCLHMLVHTEKSAVLIKAVFEIRLAVLSGLMPALLHCAGCGTYETDIMYFDYQQNRLLCSNCCDGAGTVLKLSRGALTAFRYVVLCDPKKLFSFSVSEQSLLQLSEAAERHLVNALDLMPRTLAYYKKIRTML